MKSRHFLYLVALVFFGYALRVIHFTHQPFLGWDDAIFAVEAKHLMLTGRFGYTWGRPLHVALVALVYDLFGVRAGMGALGSIFLGTLTIPVVYRLGMTTFGRRAAIAAAALLSISYFHIFWSRWLQSQAGVIFCLTLAALLYTRSLGKQANSWRWALGAGLFFGAAYTLHYSVFMLIPIWAAFELYAGFRLRWSMGVWLKHAIALAAGAALVPGVFAFGLMPPEHRWWYIAAGWYDWRGLARGCCYIDEVITPFFEDGLGHGAAGDWSYYFRAVLAFEGVGGILLMLAAWAYWIAGWVGKTRREWAGSVDAGGRGESIAGEWVAWQAIGGFAVLVAASTAGSDARAKIVALVLAPNLLLAGHLVAAVGSCFQETRLAAQLGPWPPRARAGALVSLLVVALGIWRAFPLMSMTTPYDAIAASLAAVADGPVVGLFGGSHVKPYVWRFYLGDEFVTAENADELADRCRELGPALLIKSSDTAMPEAAQQFPLIRQFSDPTTILVAAHYEESPNRSYFGGPLLPGRAGTIEVYNLTGCADLLDGG